MNAGSRQFVAKAESTDAALGCVFGYAVVSTVDGKDYTDTQGEVVPLDVVAKAVAEHEGQIACKAQHEGAQVGRIVFAMPVGLGDGDLVSKSGKTGLYIGAKFDEDTLAKFESGEFTGFSIAGSGVTVEEDYAEAA